MNFSSLFGLVCSAGVLIYGLFSSTNNIWVFYDFPSILIVFGGTFAATSIAFQVNRLFPLVKVFVVRILTGKTFSYTETIKHLIEISDLYLKSPEKIKDYLTKVPDLFMREAVEMMLDGFLDKDRLHKILNIRIESMYQQYMSDANRFKTIAKFPPAFGMMGTTIGMVVLLANLSGSDAAKNIGPAMAICLITTLYGVALANLLIIPISENLLTNSKEIKLKNIIVAQGVKLIMEQTNPIILAEELNSYLMPNDRVLLKSDQ